MSDALVYASIGELAPRIRAGDVSPVEVTTAVLSRIEQLNPTLNAFITVTAESALAQARQAESEIGRGVYRGPLHGIPVSLKDLYDTAGVRTTGGSRILAERVPTTDATATRKLAEAGAVLVGKTNLHEFAYGTTTLNPHYGQTRNPWDLERITAGSSGGSGAAVAAGLSYLSMGSETGFSIRRPAAFCGVVGLKATYGRVSRHGVLPCAWSLDHAGPLTRTVRDAALALNAVAGYDAGDPASARAPVPDFTALLGRDIKGLRVGIPRHHFAGRVEPAVEAAFEAAVKVFADLGAIPVEVRMPRARFAAPASTTTMHAEVVAVHASWIRQRPEEYGADVRERIQIGLCVTAEDYLRAQRIRRWIAEEVADVFTSVDLLATPTTPTVATRIAESPAALGDPGFVVEESLFNFLRLYALVGIPAISVPCGFSPNGLPIGLSLAGRPFDEARVLQAAHAYEGVTSWQQRRPPLVS